MQSQNFGTKKVDKTRTARLYAALRASRGRTLFECSLETYGGLVFKSWEAPTASLENSCGIVLLFDNCYIFDKLFCREKN